MSDNWSERDLLAYFLLYCANADFTENEDERRLIESKVGSVDLDDIRYEFGKDNDSESLSKIQKAVTRLNYSSAEVNGLLVHAKELFMSDEDYDILEKNMHRALKKVLGN